MDSMDSMYTSTDGGDSGMDTLYEKSGGYEGI